MKKSKGKKLLISFIISIFSIWIISLVINLSFNNKMSPIKDYPITSLSTTDNGYNIDNLAKKDSSLKTRINTEVPVYKKSEKDIKIPVLIYHEIQEEIPSDDIYNLYVTPQRLEENITTLLADGYTFITFEHLYQYNNGEIGLPEKCIILTLDDGWQGNYINAYPIFKKYNIYATIFIITDAMDSEQYLTWNQVKEMYDSGLVKIYSHGKRHIDYTTVSKQKLKDDVLYSYSQIEEHLNDTIFKAFAYPSR